MIYIGLIFAVVSVFYAFYRLYEYVKKKAQQSTNPKVYMRTFWFVLPVLVIVLLLLFSYAFLSSPFLITGLLLIFLGFSTFVLSKDLFVWVLRRLPSVRNPYEIEPIDASFKIFYDPPVKVSMSAINRHVHVIAPADAGKTKSVVAPMAAQALEKGMGVVCIDPKGDNEVISALINQLKAQGRFPEDFYYFDVAKPKISRSYNPFYGAIRTKNYHQIAATIVATMPKVGGNVTFYEKIQAEVTRALSRLLSVIPQTGKMINFIDLYALLAYLPRSVEYLLDLIEDSKDKDELAELWLKTISQEARINGDFRSYLRGLQQHLALYAFTFDPRLLNSYSPEIRLAEIFKESKLAYFSLRALDFPSGESLDIGKMVLMDLQSYAAWKYRAGVRWNVPDLVFVDEAHRVLPPEFQQVLEMARGAGIGVVVIHQSIHQFERIQKGMFQNIFANCAVKLILGADDPETAKFLSEYLGQEVKYFKAYSRAGANIWKDPIDALLPTWSEISQERYDYRVPPDELLTMRPGTAYLVVSGDKDKFGVFGKLYYMADEKPSKVEHELLACISSDCKDEWKDRDLGLCLLQTFRESLGEEAYLEETVKYIAEKKEQAKEILSQLVGGGEAEQILAPEVSYDLAPLLFNLEGQQTHHWHHR